MPWRQASSACGRKQNANRMERRDRTAANSANGLLSQQFASITDVLFKASQRRNTELQELQQRLLRLVPIPLTPKSASEPPVTVELELSQGSDSGDDRVELEQVDQSNEGTVSDELTVAASTMGLSDMAKTQVHLRGGYVSDCADDAKRMLAELNSSKQKHSGGSVQGELDDNNDLARMLADVKNISPSSKGTAVVRDNDPKAIPASLSMDEEDELSALAKRLGVDSNESEAFGGAKSTLDGLNEHEQVSGTGHFDDEDDDLETLRGKLATMFTPPSDIASQDFPHTAKNTSIVGMTSSSREDAAGVLEPECIPSAVALKLEGGNVEWEDVKDWCTQLFSNGMDEQEAKKEKEEMVKRENEKLEATIKYVLEKEERYRATEERKRLPTRMIVSNLAAGVDEEAIRIFFSKYAWNIQDVTLLSERDPVKRTRTAYIDMYSREKAVRASYEVGGIFGLIVKIKLAVE